MKAKLTVIALVIAITDVFLGFAQFSYAQQNTSFEEKYAAQAKAKGMIVEECKQALEKYKDRAVKHFNVIYSIRLTIPSHQLAVKSCPSLLHT